MACGGSSGMDACRAGEHAPAGTTLRPKPAHRPPAWAATIFSWEKNFLFRFFFCALRGSAGFPFDRVIRRHLTGTTWLAGRITPRFGRESGRSEEHTAELQPQMRIAEVVV